MKVILNYPKIQIVHMLHFINFWTPLPLYAFVRFQITPLKVCTFKLYATLMTQCYGDDYVDDTMLC